LSVFRAHSVVDVHVIIEWEEMVLLGLRQDTGYMDDHFHLPSGHLEQGESVIAAAIREVSEEAGIVLHSDQLEFVHAFHAWSAGSRVGMFFAARLAEMPEVRNLEPAKCAALEWVSLNALPVNMVPYCADVLALYRDGIMFSTRGWTKDQAA